jgi:biotin carboxyl carrier protein
MCAESITTSSNDISQAEYGALANRSHRNRHHRWTPHVPRRHAIDFHFARALGAIRFESSHYHKNSRKGDLAMKRKKFIIGLILAALLIGGGVVVWQRTRPTTTSTANLQTMPVRRGAIVATVSASGNVAAAHTATISPQTSGRVTKVNVKVSDSVKAGQTLIQMDLTDLNNSLRSAQLSLQTAQTNFDTAKAKRDERQSAHRRQSVTRKSEDRGPSGASRI